MANGYIRISQNDIIFDNDNNVVYWKNGGRILGEVVLCIDGNDDVHYYLKKTNIKKAILIDAFVPVGVQDYFLYSDSANFINVQINAEDFSGDGGGMGISITFLLPEGKYYTCKYVEANGDLKIYDAAGDGGQIGGGSGLPDTSAASAGDVLGLDSDKAPVWIPPAEAKIYLHTIKLKIDKSITINSTSYYITCICDLALYTSSNVVFTSTDFGHWLNNNNFTAITESLPVNGYANAQTSNKHCAFVLYGVFGNSTGDIYGDYYGLVSDNGSFEVNARSSTTMTFVSDTVHAL